MTDAVDDGSQFGLDLDLIHLMLLAVYANIYCHQNRSGSSTLIQVQDQGMALDSRGG